MVDTFDYNGLVSTAPRPVRKKFAKPPVKPGLENTMWRPDAMREHRECSYLPSKRGGPRKKKEKPSLSPEQESKQDDIPYNAVPSPPEFDE
ncbi:unnamed protein product, partial [Penicillium glandicola]